MRRAVTGILAHVDAGKTTLSEALLYHTGEIRKAGRVDHRDAFLDTEKLERDRGITIFSKQAEMDIDDLHLTLLDTPGHVDFGAEMERTLSVLDYGILVISGIDGVQSHTLTLWNLLERAGIPVFIFVNKMDISHRSRQDLMEELVSSFGEGCVDFSEMDAEALAVNDEALLEHFIAGEELPDDEIRQAVAGRRIFPCYFGSALKMEGTREFVAGLSRYMKGYAGAKERRVRVYKISRDEQGNRLTHLKVLGGSIAVKEELNGEKINEIRIYNGAGYKTVASAAAGMVCAVTGLSQTKPYTDEAVLQPVLAYRAQLTDGQDPHAVLAKLKILEDEEPTLQVGWNSRLGEITVQIMGEVQLEILSDIIKERFGMHIEFGEGDIMYRETVAKRVEGVGHFEPLRHYAEVHLLLEPGPRGSGILLDTKCSTDELDVNWQRLILTHLAEKEHLGVLTGSPLTDTRITLLTGRAHEKHTEGGDFREATYRAVRQGLMEAGCVLLEPWYEFSIEVPAECVGRVMSDVQRMGGEFDPPESEGSHSIVAGRAPVRTMRGYQRELNSFTGGSGRMAMRPGGYEKCSDQKEVCAGIGYHPERDLENTADSVFCRNGSGFTVKWDHVKEHMHVDSKENRAVSANLNSIDPRELDAIFEGTYGSTGSRRKYIEARYNAAEGADISRKPYRGREKTEGPLYLLIDGYNLIHAWKELKALSDEDFGTARDALVDKLSNYQGYTGNHVIVVFDAYKVKNNPGSVERVGGLDVVYTAEAETADMYIEKVTHKIAGKHRVRVVTSDGMEQLIILGHGAIRTSSRTFIDEIKEVEKEIREYID